MRSAQAPFGTRAIMKNLSMCVMITLHFVSFGMIGMKGKFLRHETCELCFVDSDERRNLLFDK